MAQKTELTLARAIKFEGESGAQQSVSVLKLRRATMTDLAHVVIGNPPSIQYAEVIARCAQNVSMEAVLGGSAKNSGLFNRTVVGQFLGADKGQKVQSMIGDDHIDLFVPITVKKQGGAEEGTSEISTLKMREPTLEEVGFIPTEVVTVGHYLELAANCVTGIPEEAVRKCDAENALPLIAWAANFIGEGPASGEI